MRFTHADDDVSVGGAAVCYVYIYIIIVYVRVLFVAAHRAVNAT